jgi:hypothetical protein
MVVAFEVFEVVFDVVFEVVKYCLEVAVLEFQFSY